jgi:hypothetical protein
MLAGAAAGNGRRGKRSCRCLVQLRIACGVRGASEFTVRVNVCTMHKCYGAGGIAHCKAHDEQAVDVECMVEQDTGHGVHMPRDGLAAMCDWEAFCRWTRATRRASASRCSAAYETCRLPSSCDQTGRRQGGVRTTMSEKYLLPNTVPLQLFHKGKARENERY